MEFDKKIKTLIGIYILLLCLAAGVLVFLVKQAAQNFERTKAGKEVGAFVDEWFTPEGE